MAPDPHQERCRSPLSLVRERLLISLHLGQKSPGERVPSVRAMARLTGLGRKTVHRAYEQLAREGLVELRPGSGTFFAEGGEELLRVSTGQLLEAVERLGREAESLGMSLEQLARVISLYSGVRPVEAVLAVTECNHEQLGLMSRELDSALSAEVRPVLLSDLKADPLGCLRGCSGIVTTDCHRQEVRAVVQSFRLPVYRVALASRFTHVLVGAASRAHVLMVVSDARYRGIFQRMLLKMKVPQATVARLEILEPAPARRYLQSVSGEVLMYVSPLVEDRLDALSSPGNGNHRLEPGPYLDAASIDHLRAQMAADMALARPELTRISHSA